MNWLKGLHCFTKRSKFRTCVLGRLENGVLVAKNNLFLSSLAQRGYVAAASLQLSGCTSTQPQVILNSARNIAWRVKLPFGLSRSILAAEKYAMAISWRHKHSINTDPDLSRDFLVQLWVEDNKRRTSERKRRRKVHKYVDSGDTLVGGQTSFGVPHGSYDEMKPALKQPPTSQPVTGFLKPTSLEEVIFQSF